MDLLVATFAVAVIGSAVTIATWLFRDRVFYRIWARIPRKPPVLQVSLGGTYSGADKRGFSVTVEITNSQRSFVEVKDLRLVAWADWGPVHRLNLTTKDAEGRLGAHERKHAFATLMDVDKFCGWAEWMTLTARGTVDDRRVIYSLRVNRAITMAGRTRKHVPDVADAPIWNVPCF